MVLQHPAIQMATLYGRSTSDDWSCLAAMSAGVDNVTEQGSWEQKILKSWLWTGMGAGDNIEEEFLKTPLGRQEV
jgi:hypothetical protein